MQFFPLLGGPAGFPSPGAAGQTVSAGYTGMSPARVLLVEDSEYQRMLVAMFLQGAEVVEAHNGLEAVVVAHGAGARGVPFDLILLDLDMPLFDGQHVARLLRAMEASRQAGCPPMHIVAISAKAEDMSEACRAAGVDAAIVKPVSVAAVAAAVAEAEARRDAPQKAATAAATATAAPPPTRDTVIQLARLCARAFADAGDVRGDLPLRDDGLEAALRWALDFLGLSKEEEGDREALCRRVDAALEQLTAHDA